MPVNKKEDVKGGGGAYLLRVALPMRGEAVKKNEVGGAKRSALISKRSEQNGASEKKHPTHFLLSLTSIGPNFEEWIDVV